MKANLLRATLLLLFLSILQGAGAVNIGDLKYDLDEETLTASVTGYRGEYLESVVIPSSVTYNEVSYLVTSIGKNAFSDHPCLESVMIPNTVIFIGDGAFGNCTHLTYLTIPNSVTSIGRGAFHRCSDLTSITIPNSVTIIGSRAFGICTGLTSLTIPNSVTSIGEGAFGGCTGLTSIDVDDGNPNYVSLDGNVYDRSVSTIICCPAGKTSVTIPESVTTIGDGAFFGCSGLSSITIPSSVTSIGVFAFDNCSNMTSVTIPDSVTSIGYWAFFRCSSLISVTIPTSVTSIQEFTFCGCSSLASVTIPDSVTSIGGGAFQGCEGLVSVTIPNSVTSIGRSAFNDCTGLTSVTIGDSVASIEIYAFMDCYNLTDLYSLATHPAAATEDAFYGVNRSCKLHVPNGSAKLYRSAEGWKYFLTIREDATSIDDITDDPVTDIAGYYNINGERSDNPCPGVNIVILTDGSTRKVIY